MDSFVANVNTKKRLLTLVSKFSIFDVCTSLYTPLRKEASKEGKTKIILRPISVGELAMTNRIVILTFSCIMLKNGETDFKDSRASLLSKFFTKSEFSPF